jgi:hypothetical protein
VVCGFGTCCGRRFEIKKNVTDVVLLNMCWRLLAYSLFEVIFNKKFRNSEFRKIQGFAFFLYSFLSNSNFKMISNKNPGKPK